MLYTLLRFLRFYVFLIPFPHFPFFTVLRFSFFFVSLVSLLFCVCVGRIYLEHSKFPLRRESAKFVVANPRQTAHARGYGRRAQDNRSFGRARQAHTRALPTPHFWDIFASLHFLSILFLRIHVFYVFTFFAFLRFSRFYVSLFAIFRFFAFITFSRFYISSFQRFYAFAFFSPLCSAPPFEFFCVFVGQIYPYLSKFPLRRPLARLFQERARKAARVSRYGRPARGNRSFGHADFDPTNARGRRTVGRYARPSFRICSRRYISCSFFFLRSHVFYVFAFFTFLRFLRFYVFSVLRFQ